MAEHKVVSLKRRKVGSIELPDAAFDYPLKRHLLYEAVLHYQATARRGTHKVKNRVEVSGGGKRPWRQKGTGRARAGSIRSPLWRGGGVVHGPQPRDYGYRFPKMARRRALASALSELRREDGLVIVNEWKLESHKTKEFAELVRSSLKLEGKVLAVYDGENEQLELAARNHPELGAVRALQLHAFHVLNVDKVVMSKAAAEQLGEVLAK